MNDSSARSKGNRNEQAAIILSSFHSLQFQTESFLWGEITLDLFSVVLFDNFHYVLHLSRVYALAKSFFTFVLLSV